MLHDALLWIASGLMWELFYVSIKLLTFLCADDHYANETLYLKFIILDRKSKRNTVLSGFNFIFKSFTYTTVVSQN
jgi:hypothetical protein